MSFAAAARYVMTRSLPLLLGLATLAADQASKLYLLYGLKLREHAPIRLAPFAELVVYWNQGVSFGLFQQQTDLGRWFLVVLSLVAAVVLGTWAARTRSAVLAASLALIVGGAIGNAIDRVLHGAVFDFVHLHAGPYSWYVFNVADAAIVAGVVGLLYDSFVLDRRRARSAATSSPP
jgi:signal peptidase II